MVPTGFSDFALQRRIRQSPVTENLPLSCADFLPRPYLGKTATSTGQRPALHHADDSSRFRSSAAACLHRHRPDGVMNMTGGDRRIAPIYIVTILSSLVRSAQVNSRSKYRPTSACKTLRRVSDLGRETCAAAALKGCVRQSASMRKLNAWHISCPFSVDHPEFRRPFHDSATTRSGVVRFSCCAARLRQIWRSREPSTGNHERNNRHGAEQCGFGNRG